MRDLTIIRRIDRALKQLYNLSFAFCAEDFLISVPPEALGVGNAALRGAVYLKEVTPPGQESELGLGIYLSQRVRRELGGFGRWREHWSTTQLDAFTVAAEEISHFHLLLFHALQDRQLSQLDLELQGEIDKFLLTYYTMGGRPESFGPLFERLFERYRLAESLNDEQKARYHDATQLARRFILKNSRVSTDPARREWGFRVLRRFYRLGSAEKISLIVG